MSEHMVPSDVVQHVIVKFLTCWDSDKSQSTVWWWNSLKDQGVWLE